MVLTFLIQGSLGHLAWGYPSIILGLRVLCSDIMFVDSEDLESLVFLDFAGLQVHIQWLFDSLGLSLRQSERRGR